MHVTLCWTCAVTTGTFIVCTSHSVGAACVHPGATAPPTYIHDPPTDNVAAAIGHAQGHRCV